MSLGFGLGAGLKALTASQLGMQTAGNNVANANTPGYSRQRVDLSSALSFNFGSFQIGNGVDVNGITRIVDGGLERRIQMQLGLVGSAVLDEQRYRQIENIFGEPDNGLSNQFQDLFGSLDQLRTDPSNRALRGGLVQAGDSMGREFRLLSERLNDLSGSTFEEVRGLARLVNQSTARIASLNDQIMATEASGSIANGLRDTRAQEIRNLGELIDVRPIERSTGSVDLLLGGSQIVAGGRSVELSVGRSEENKTEVMLGANNTPVQLREGRIAALIRQESANLPEFTSRIDELARNTIVEWNRLHSTGMPGSGPFTSLVSAYGIRDNNNNGRAGDELLSQANFPFPVQQGELYISVTNEATGEFERTRIDIDPSTMTLDSFAAELSAIDNVSASVDPSGRLRITAQDGFGFDFSSRLDTRPDKAGTFGGTSPVIGSTGSGPYDLSGQTFPVSFDVATSDGTTTTNTTVTLDASDFVNSTSATTAELVAAINADLGAAGTASSVGGRLVIQAGTSGQDARMAFSDLGGGSALGDLGLSTATANGRDQALQVSVEGSYAGATNEEFTFVPEGNGVIGQTQGLRMRVLDSDGTVVATLDVGRGYQAGEPIAVGNGIRISFGPGEVSQTSGQAFALDALADSDTSDILVATGTNVFFLGSSAADIAVNEQLLQDPDRVAAGLSSSGDPGNLNRMSMLRDLDLEALGNSSIEDFYTTIVGDIGFEASAARQTLQSQDELLAQLNADRESISGVNIDEEMVDLLRYQQSYEAAARLISVAQEMTDVLINLAR